MTSVPAFIGRIRYDSAFTRKGSAIDSNHLFVIGRNERLDNFRDFELLLGYPLDKDQTNVDYHPANMSTPVIMFAFYFNQVKPEHVYTTAEAFDWLIAPRFAVSTFATKELIESQSEEAIRNHLEYYVDLAEAALFHHYLGVLSFLLTSAPVDVRDAYSHLTTGILDLEPGTKNIYYEVPTYLVFPTVYSPSTLTVSGLYSAGTQWFQTQEFLNVRQRLVKVAIDQRGTMIGRRLMVAYSDWLVNSFRRQFLDVFDVTRVKDRLDERNTYRITFERYAIWSVPVIRIQSGVSIAGVPYIFPAVTVNPDPLFSPIPATHERPLGLSPSQIEALVNFVG